MGISPSPVERPRRALRAGGGADARTATLRSQMEGVIYDKELVESIFKEAPERYSERPGGYCRVVREPRRRRGDAAEMAVIELV